MKIYVASSWRNTVYGALVDLLETMDHSVWNWRAPPTGGQGFSWKSVDADYNGGTIDIAGLQRMLSQPSAQAGFASDLAGMCWADICILLLPSGKSAHMEAGYMKGRGKPVYVLRPLPDEPDLMHLLFDGIYADFRNIPGISK